MVITFGDKGQHVRMLQRALNKEGARIKEDGDYGEKTEAAVIAFQKAHGLIPDGIAGPQTQRALAGTPDPKALTQKAIQQAADDLGVPVAAVMAITDVEAAGEGFLANGKPKILFERHIMYRQLCLVRHNDENEATRTAAADDLVITLPNLVNPLPGGYAGGASEHQRLARARLIDDHSALSATSWGLFQIMGYHYQRLGHETPQAFVDSLSTGEDAHLSAFARFIQTDPALHKALKGKKWAQFARLYNGPAYKRNLYDIRLARAYHRHLNSTSPTEAT